MLLNSIIQDALLLCQLRRLSSSVPVDLSVWCVVCTGSELQRLEYMAGYQDRILSNGHQAAWSGRVPYGALNPSGALIPSHTKIAV